MRNKHLGEFDDTDYDALATFDDTVIYEANVTDDTVYDPAYDDVVYDPYTVPIDPSVDPGNVTSATASDGTSQNVDVDGSTVIYSPDGGAYMVDADGTIYSIQADGTVDIVTPEGNVYYSNTQYQEATGHSIPTKSGTSMSETLATIGELSKFALTQIAAWKNVGQPQPVLARPVVQASGAVVTPNKNGTITTKLPNGKTTVARMPVGKPYTFPDGTTVVNNGNGTITTVDASGNAATSSIASTPISSGGIGNLGIMAAFGIGLLLISGT